MALIIEYEKCQDIISVQGTKTLRAARDCFICLYSDNRKNSKESSHRILIFSHQPYQLGSNKKPSRTQSILFFSIFVSCYSLTFDTNKIKTNKAKTLHFQTNMNIFYPASIIALPIFQPNYFQLFLFK